VLIGPVRYFVLDFVWRFVTDPVSHACWSGLTGYFIGLAVTRRHRWYAVAWIGLAAAAILHGLNDWGRVNGHPLWIVVVAISGILFLGYARAGSGGGPHAAADAMLPTFSRHGTPDGHPAAVPDRRPAPDALSGRTPGPWWEHLELDRPDSGGAHPAGGTAGMAASPQERRTLAVMLRAARVGDIRGVLSPSVMSETAPERGRAPRVVLADDDVLLREGLASLLDRSGFDVVGQAGNGPGLLALVRSARPDLAIIDIRMPPAQATEGLQAAGGGRELRRDSC